MRYFAIFMVILTAFFFMFLASVFPAHGDEPKAVIYRGPAGVYIPQDEEVVVMLSDGNLLVGRPGGEKVHVDLTTPPPAPAPAGEHFVYRNGQLVGSGSTVYVDPRDQIDLREQDIREIETLAELELDQRQQAQDERNDQHDNRVDWSEEARDWQRDRDRRAEDERRAEERAKRDKQRRREDLRRDAQRTGENMADRAQDSVRRGIDRLERWSQN